MSESFLNELEQETKALTASLDIALSQVSNHEKQGFESVKGLKDTYSKLLSQVEDKKTVYAKQIETAAGLAATAAKTGDTVTPAKMGIQIKFYVSELKKIQTIIKSLSSMPSKFYQLNLAIVSQMTYLDTVSKSLSEVKVKADKQIKDSQDTLEKQLKSLTSIGVSASAKKASLANATAIEAQIKTLQLDIANLGSNADPIQLAALNKTLTQKKVERDIYLEDAKHG